MLARSLLRKHRTLPFGALLAACSAVPPATFPEFQDHHVAAEFVVPPDGCLHLPATTRALVVRELALEPLPVREQFAAGSRWFVYPAGTAVRAELRLRAYVQNGRVPSLREILRDARRIVPLEAP